MGCCSTPNHEVESDRYLAQGIGLSVELFGGCGAFFCIGGGLLGTLLRLLDGATDLIDAASLFFTTEADLLDEDFHAGKDLVDFFS